MNERSGDWTTQERQSIQYALADDRPDIMAGNKQPITDQPEKVNEILKQEQRDYDCTPCRVVGMFPPLCFYLRLYGLLLTF